MSDHSQTAKHYQAASGCLNGKVILVTGAGDGIGRVAAITYAQLGAEVILAGRTEAKLEKVYDEIVAAGHTTPAICPIDLATLTEDQALEMAGTFEEAFGRLDGLLHNASLLGQRTPIANYKASTWQEVMQVNVNAGFLLTKALLPLLEKSKDASVVFTSSGVGRTGRAYWGAYAVSKFATEGMMQVLAQEVDGIGNIRVNCINPGGTATNMRSTAFPAEDPNTLPTPADIMPTYVYLMSADSKEVNGESLNAQ